MEAIRSALHRERPDGARRVNLCEVDQAQSGRHGGVRLASARARRSSASIRATVATSSSAVPVWYGMPPTWALVSASTRSAPFSANRRRGCAAARGPLR